MIDVGLSSNFPHLVECLKHVGCPPDTIDMVILSHEHLDHIGAACHFAGRTIIAAHRLAANKIMLRDDFSMLRKMFNEPNVPINVDIWLEEGNLLDLGNFRLNVMYTPGHTSACISLFDPDQGLLFAADTLMPGGVMGGVFGSGSISDYIQSLERLKGLNSKISVRPWPVVRYAAGRRADRAPALACAVVRYRPAVRRARRPVQLRADHAVGARSEQAGRRITPQSRVPGAMQRSSRCFAEPGTLPSAGVRDDSGSATHRYARASRYAASGDRAGAAISPPARPATHSCQRHASENVLPTAARRRRCP